MIKQLPSRLFFILAALLVIILVAFRHPYFKAKLFSSYRAELFQQFQSQLANKEFDAEKYWQFRERFSPGTLLRQEEFTGFFATFRITKVQEGITPLFFYESDKLKSVDSLISFDTGTALKMLQEEFSGEVIERSDKYILIKVSETEYVFAFVESIEEMMRVNGMFDYIPKERELLTDKLWYNATYLEVD